MSDRLAVWGDPIGHSRSPLIHAAAYSVLGLDWTFVRTQVAAEDFVATLNGLDMSWRGLAVTMPLKTVAAESSIDPDELVGLTGVANTIDLRRGRRGYNTDIGGMIRALDEIQAPDTGTVRILGGGATATSAVVAASRRGADHIEIVVRRPDAAADLVALANRLGMSVALVMFDEVVGSARPAALTVATLPNGATVAAEIAEFLAATGGVLFDAAYHPWPSSLARLWRPESAFSGEGMLLNQALLQVRIFVSGDADEPLHQEERVLAEMRRALVKD